MTAEQIAELGDSARHELNEHGRVRVEYQPGNGTRYDVLITLPGPGVSIGKHGCVDHEWGSEERWIVSLLSVHTAAEMNRGAPLPGYLAEKLARGNLADGCALHLLLAAIADMEPRVSLAQAGVWDAD